MRSDDDGEMMFIYTIEKMDEGREGLEGRALYIIGIVYLIWDKETKYQGLNTLGNERHDNDSGDQLQPRALPSEAISSPIENT